MTTKNIDLALAQRVESLLTEFTELLDSTTELPGDLRAKIRQAEFCLYKINKYILREVQQEKNQ